MPKNAFAHSDANKDPVSRGGLLQTLRAKLIRSRVAIALAAIAAPVPTQQSPHWQVTPSKPVLTVGIDGLPVAQEITTFSFGSRFRTIPKGVGPAAIAANPSPTFVRNGQEFNATFSVKPAPGSTSKNCLLTMTVIASGTETIGAPQSQFVVNSYELAATRDDLFLDSNGNYNIDTAVTPNLPPPPSKTTLDLPTSGAEPTIPMVAPVVSELPNPINVTGADRVTATATYTAGLLPVPTTEHFSLTPGQLNVLCDFKNGTSRTNTTPASVLDSFGP